MLFFTHEEVQELGFLAMMAGGKHISAEGLTVELQLGVAVLGGDLGPNINLNVGWSFWPWEPRG